MLAERFYVFSFFIDGIHKKIQRLKFDFSAKFNVKNVQLFWIYELSSHPNGLTATELAAKTKVSRSLVSRETEHLRKNGYIQLQEDLHEKRKNYNARILLTEKGKKMALQIGAEAKKIQEQVSQGISLEELAAFYVTLEKLYQNISTITNGHDEAEHLKKDISSIIAPLTFSMQNTSKSSKSIDKS